MLPQSLAIIIPAYKQTFLERALDSLAQQSEKNFTVYIGDDSSPHDLYSIVEKFEASLKIVYQRFDDNLGGKDLVQQWNRCVDLTKGESWVWLFSDDDEMDANCVEVFYAALEQQPQCDLFHFDVDIIDEHDKVIGSTNKYPQCMQVSDFHAGRIKSTIRSYVVEYIFRKETFLACGRFENFDLAWSSDDATWMKIARRNGIYTLSNAKIKWRRSSENITPNVNDPAIAQRKIGSLLSYTRWQMRFFEQYNIPDQTSSFNKLIWFLRNVKNFKYIFSRRRRMDMVADYLTVIKARHLLIFAYLYFLLTDYKKARFVPSL